MTDDPDQRLEKIRRAIAHADKCWGYVNADRLYKWWSAYGSNEREDLLFLLAEVDSLRAGMKAAREKAFRDLDERLSRQLVAIATDETPITDTTNDERYGALRLARREIRALKEAPPCS